MLGIFDSGIGGLTVVRELLRRYPSASFMYLGDTARTPYGNKSKETIERYALEDAAFLVAKGATTIVVACNTVSATAMDALRRTYPAHPMIDVIAPAVMAAVQVSRGRVGVIGTRATIASGMYERRVTEQSSSTRVTSVACPLFVPLVEEGWLSARETKQIARRYLTPLVREQIDTLILGCTHYPMLRNVIQARVGRNVHVIDSAACVTDLLEREYGQELQASHPPRQRYYVTDENPRTVEIAHAWLRQSIAMERIQLRSA
jgi:glutamate racemase